MSVTKCIRNKDGKKKVFYRAQVYVSGIRIADKVFETQGAAHTWHDQEKEKLERGFSGSDSVPDYRFDECLSLFMKERQSKLELSSRQSRAVRAAHLRNCPISNLNMKQIRSNAIDIWLEWLGRQGTAKNPSRKSFTQELKFLSSMLHWYRDYIDADFVVPITKRHRESAAYKKNAPRRPDYFAKPEEVRRWIDWLRSHRKPVYYRLACFLLLTGCRVGEAAGLCWSEIDLERRIARVVRVAVWDHHSKQPHLEERAKTDGSIRIVILPELLVTLLREMKEEANGSSGPVFRGRDLGILKYNAIQSAFNAGFKSLGLP
jgi:hypothetical protein